MMSFQSRLIIFVAICASLIEIVDISIVNVALPTMMGNLGCTLDEISVIITGYSIANAIVLPISAWLGERLGRRRYYLGCIFIFTSASLACGLSPNLSTLVIFRILQGLAGGALLPTSQALISEQFTKEKAGLGMAIFGMSVTIGPALGPVLGGYLTDNFGWRSIFNVNLPIGIMTFLVGLTCIRNRDGHEIDPKSKFDFIGLILLVLGIGFLQFFLERGQANDWFNSYLITAAIIISIISLVLLVLWESRFPFPLVNIFLFKQKIVLCGVLLMICLGFFLYGTVFALPVFVQTAFHYTATQSGAMLISSSFLTALLMPFVGKSVHSISEPRILICIGFVFVEICLFLFTQFSSMTSYNEILIALFARGIALAFLFIPINALVFNQFFGYELGQVAGLLNLFRQIGGSIGIALIGTIYTRSADKNYHYLIENVSLLNKNIANYYSSSLSNMTQKFPLNIGFTVHSNAVLKILYNRVHEQAFILGFIDVTSSMTVICIFAFIPLYFLSVKK